MSKDAQIRCLVESLTHAYPNITMHVIDDDTWGNYSLAFSMTLTVFVFVSNTMLIYGLHKTSRNLSLTNKLFIYLSILDIVTTCFGVTCTNMTWYVENMPCVGTFIAVSIRNGLDFLAFLMFFNISVLRYLSIIRPFLRIGGKQRMVVMLAEILCACVLSIVYFIGIDNLTIESVGSFQFMISTLFFIAITVNSTVNMLSYRAMRLIKNKKSIIAKPNDFETKTKCNVSSLKSEQKKEAAVVTLIVITVCYGVSNLPIFAYTLVTGFAATHYIDELGTKQNGINPLLVNLFYLIHLTNAGLNATIYILRCGQIKTFFKMKITKCFSRYVV